MILLPHLNMKSCNPCTELAFKVSLGISGPEHWTGENIKWEITLNGITISYVSSLCGDFGDFRLPSLVKDDYRGAGKRSFPDRQTHLTQCTE
jgi:hypothetical protein